MTTITIKEDTPFDATEFDSVKDFLLAWLLYEKYGTVPVELGIYSGELTDEQKKDKEDILRMSEDSLHNLS